MQPLIIAIDGPSGVGKTTASRLVARDLHIPHIDTGAMYRAIGLAAIRGGISTRDEKRVEELASSVHIEFIPGERGRILLNGEDITPHIRTPEISMAASDVSAIPAVRRILVKLQQQMGRERGGVLEGRDIGTKVFPDTPFKFFLTARSAVRAQRRYRELLAKGEATDLQTVLEDTEKRDLQDSTRADSPLSYDQSYTVIDTSDLSIDQVVSKIVEAVRRNDRG